MDFNIQHGINPHMAVKDIEDAKEERRYNESLENARAQTAIMQAQLEAMQARLELARTEAAAATAAAQKEADIAQKEAEEAKKIGLSANRIAVRAIIISALVPFIEFILNLLFTYLSH